ncbi:PHD/FYVE-zinc-finger like domain-containing protein [Hypomontagnella monticulosa]|nr:PHD/FYVE-zinc-finger like domain-containing protein [Hypomontagnella monticulosa]
MGSMEDTLESWLADAAGQDDNVVMTDIADVSHPNSYDDGRDGHELEGPPVYDGSVPDSHDDGKPDGSMSEGLSPAGPSPVGSRQFPIEVLLRPPPNREAYEPIKSSQTVWKVFDQYEDDDETICIVEFIDGHIEEVAYDDMVRLKNGRRAAQEYQERRLDMSQLVTGRQPSKRANSEDDDYQSDSHDSGRLRTRKRPKIATRRSVRQASIQASRQASAQVTDNEDHEMNDYDDESDEDMDEVISDRITRRQSSLSKPSVGRVTRSKGATRSAQHATDGSEDELAQNHPSHQNDDDSDDGDDFIPLIRSDIGNVGKKSARNKKKPQTRRTSNKYVEEDSEIEFEPSRRSRRSTKASKSMRDPELDDEYEVVDDKATSAPKVAAVKETFEKHAKDSSFRSAHCEVCGTCGFGADRAKGPLVLCQGCSYSYHQPCLGNRSARDHRVTKVGPNEFVLQCKFCIGLQKKKDERAPDHSICQACKQNGPSCAEFSAKKTAKQEEKARLDNGGVDPITDVRPELINNTDNVLFRCSACKRAYHYEHLPSIVAIHDPSLSIRDEALKEYALAGWVCKECLDDKPRIQALVAWRPVDQAAYIPGQQVHHFTEDEIEYLVKWEHRSHNRDEWMPGAWVHGVAAATMRTAFHKREENRLPKMTAESAIERGWLTPDVILMVRYQPGSIASSKAEDLARISDVRSVFVKFRGLGYDEAVWDDPPPSSSEPLWAAFSEAYEEFLNGKYFPSPSDQSMRNRINHYRSLDFEKECELASQPIGLREGRTLMKYQIEGVNWLLYNFHQQQNVILADEMGLGKTIQVVSYITALVEDKPKCWPFLVIVPNATCPNWRRELKDWAPGLRVVTYHGGQAAQDKAYKYELFPNGVKDGMKAHVVIMSYESASTLGAEFRSVKWAGLIVDEGQRLKNQDTQLYKALIEMKIPSRILLTGTPLQNNKLELFTLLQFIDTQHNAQDLDAQYSDLTKDNINQLHDLIRPYFLRRTKDEVLRFLPKMAQIIVPVTMSVLQEKLSKSIMSRNPELIKAIITKGKMKAGDRKGLTNIMSDLRQCLCHPFCFSSNVEDRTVSEEQMHRNLIEASPKLTLLNIVLPKLKAEGHRVLIFSQFLGCLDILEDFLTILGLRYGRIDGGIDGPKKQVQIDAFNAPDSPLFAMLLSTRAGGVGINLATADTVIIYDPDWNPHQDIQAISRAHRIGQKKKVLCLQLITKDTIEENILQAGKKKLALDFALVESLDADTDMSGDLETILKRGAEALFSDKDKVKITYDAKAVDRLLDRSQIGENATGDNNSSNPITSNNSANKKFSVARVWAKDSAMVIEDVDNLGGDESLAANTDVWEKILKQREEEHQRELAAKQEVLGRGARRRGTQGVDYNSSRRPEPDSGGSDIDGEDELYIDNGVDEDEDEVYDTNYDMVAEGSMPARRKSQKAPLPTLPPTLPSTRPSTYPSTLPLHLTLPPTLPAMQSATPRVRLPSNLPGPTLAIPASTAQNQLQKGARYRMTKAEQNQAMAAGLSQASEAERRRVIAAENSRAQQLATHTTKPLKYRPSVYQTQVAASMPVAQPPSQTRALPSQTFPPQDISLSGGVNPNFVVSIPRRGQPPLPNTNPSFTNAHLPVPPSNVLRSTPTVNPPLPAAQPSGFSKNFPILPTGEGGSCLVCGSKHTPNEYCVDFNSEISLRIALDSLRVRGDTPNVRAYRDILTRRLRQVRGQSG